MSVTLSLFAGAGAQFFDNNGTPLSGGKIYTYAAGTTTPNPTYTTNSDASLHTNPIVLDAAGRVSSGGEIWLKVGVGYKFVVKTSVDVLIATYDNIPSSAQPPAANDADSIMYEQGYTVNAGSFVIGSTYRIVTVGTTDYTLIGASANSVGLHFVATGVGSGTGTAELSQTVETKLRETVSVLDFGAVADGVADDSQAFIDAIATGKRVYVPEGSYKINNVALSAGAYLYGDGFQKTFLVVDSSGTFAYGLNFTGSYCTLADLNIAGAGENLMGTTAGAFYTTFYNVWIGECREAFRVGHNMYWSRFINTVLRECDKGIYTAAGQVLNAVQFISCSTFNATPGGDYAIDIDGSDGISFIGCDIQNQGVKLANCKDIVFSGGYYESYTQTNPAIKLNASSVRLDGIHAPDGTYFDIDGSSAAVLSGKAPPVFAGLFTGVSHQMYGGMADVVATVENLFPAPSGGSNLANENLYDSVGSTGTVSTVGGKTRISVTGNQSNGFQVTGEGIGVYARWRVVSGAAAIKLYNVTTSQQDEINSATSTDFHESYLFSSSSTNDPLVAFLSNDNNPAVIEIDKLYVANRKVFFNDSAAVAINFNESSFESRAVAVIGGGAPATTIFSFDTFGNAGPGFYLVTVFRSDRNLSSAVEWATAWVTVHSNGALTLTPIVNNIITLSVSGLNLQASTLGANVVVTPTFTRMTPFVV